MTRTEAHTPPLDRPTPHRNVTDLLGLRAAEAPDHVAFEVPDGQGWRPITTAEFLADVRALARGLVAEGLEIADRVAIMGSTSYDWAVADLACWFAGAVVVPIHETAAPTQIADILADAQVRLALSGSRDQADALAAALPPDSLGAFPLDDLSDLIANGTSVPPTELERRRLAATLDDVATVVYTSGTTGDPRGALITHGNFVHQVLNVAGAYSEVVRDDGNTIIFLPLSHVLARALQLACIAGGMRVAHLADPKAVVGVLEQLRPTFLVVVPRVLEKVHSAVAKRARGVGLGPLWRVAERTAIAWGALVETHSTDAASVGLRLRHALVDRVFGRRIRALLGGRLSVILSGAAPLDADLCRFFLGMGVTIVEGYGLTETTAPITGNLPDNLRAGSVGIPLPGTSVRIADDGEVWVRGPGVIPGYRNPSEDEQAFRDGWFRTGDLGSLDDDGRLTLHGRCKEVLVTSSGKNVTPVAWETRVAQHPLVAHAVVVGDGRPYLSALIFLDPEAVDGLPQAETGGVLVVPDGRWRPSVEHAIESANALVSRPEQVRAVEFVSADLSVAGGLVTPHHETETSRGVGRGVRDRCEAVRVAGAYFYIER